MTLTNPYNFTRDNRDQWTSDRALKAAGWDEGAAAENSRIIGLLRDRYPLGSPEYAVAMKIASDLLDEPAEEGTT